MTEHEVTDSPINWVAEHVRGYVESDGAKGHSWMGANTLLLTLAVRLEDELARRTEHTGDEDLLVRRQRYLKGTLLFDHASHPSVALLVLATPAGHAIFPPHRSSR